MPTAGTADGDRLRVGGLARRERRVLAVATDYLQGWLLWVVMPLVVVWIGVGGAMLRRGVKALVSRNQARLGRCLLISFLAGLGGAIATAIVGFLVATLAKQCDFKLFLPAALILPVVFVAITFTVVYASFEAPVRALLRISGVAFAGPILAVVVGGTPALWHAYTAQQQEYARQESKARLEYLFRAMAFHYERSQPPRTLQDLVQKNVVRADVLKCRRDTGRDVDYFYLATPLIPPDQVSQRILACDLIDNHGGLGRMVLFVNGDVRWYSRDELPGLLDLPENRTFALTLGEAEKAISDPMAGKPLTPVPAPAAPKPPAPKPAAPKPATPPAKAK